MPRKILSLRVMDALKFFIVTILGLSLDTSQVKATDGGYSDWSKCSECSVTCGGGTQIFRRTCLPINGLKNCSELGPNYKTVLCNEQECAVDGGYTDWSISECSVTCGGGTQTLTRTCTNPPPSNGGRNCVRFGPAAEEAPCNEQECPVDGGYTDWTECSGCSVTCGGGIKTFTRTCTNPPPSNGGRDCSGLGQSVKKEPCNEHDCPPPCTAGLDIALVLDKSSSIKKSKLRMAIDFLGELVKHFDPAPDADHVGLITFDKKANLVFSFADSEFYDKDKLLEKIAGEPIKTGRGTRTDLALKMGRDELFTETGGDRPDKPNVMIVLTDGKPHLSGKKKFNFEAFGDLAKDIRESGVNIEAVGIGKRINTETLKLIAGDETRVVQVDDFDDLKDNLDEIKAKACSG